MRFSGVSSNYSNSNGYGNPIIWNVGRLQDTLSTAVKSAETPHGMKHKRLEPVILI